MTNVQLQILHNSEIINIFLTFLMPHARKQKNRAFCYFCNSVQKLPVCAQCGEYTARVIGVMLERYSF